MEKYIADAISSYLLNVLIDPVEAYLVLIILQIAYHIYQIQNKCLFDIELEVTIPLSERLIFCSVL
jgi:hypothetical protein